MDKNKKNKMITFIVLIIGILVLTWFIVIYPLIDFSKKETSVLDASKKYYEKNSGLLPKEGEMTTVTLRTLLSQKYISTIKSTYNRKYCNVDNSWVKVKRKSGEYNYYVYLECGNMKSTIDHIGPTIKLNGDEEIEIEKDSTFKDPGINSVYDDTDGKMSVKDVTITGNVNTKKIGTYTLKYSATDSFENKNTVTRTVKVVQTLDKLVKNNTDKDNIYKGNIINNYIEFSNMLFRIVGLNSDGTVKIVSDETIGTVNYSDAYDWLNDYFYDHLTDKAKKYMVKQKFCSSKVSQDKFATVKNNCDDTKKEYVGMLSLSDYNNSISEGITYLYPNNIAWTSDYTTDNSAVATRIFFANENNEDLKYMAFSKKYNFALYPVVNLKTNIKITSGNGTIGNPYKFAKVSSGKAGDKINTRYTGEYVSYGGNTYRIIDIEDDNAKVISMNAYGNDIAYTDNSKEIYNPNNKGNVGYYIENNTSKQYKTDIFVKHQISVPTYNDTATYNGKKTTKKYTVKFAAPNMYEMFSGALPYNGNSYWLSTSSKKIAYVVSQTNVIFYLNEERPKMAGVRFVGYLDKNVTILSGKGTEYNPYILQK